MQPGSQRPPTELAARACASAATHSAPRTNQSLRCGQAHLEVQLGSTTYVLDTGELAYMIDAKTATCKQRPKTKRVVLEMPKQDKARTWKKLTAV